VSLYWEVLQTLLPPHDIFVHVNTAEGTTIAQHDGEPLVGNVPAPSGSWLPGEYLVTQHRMVVSNGHATIPDPLAFEIQAGLYEPSSGVRLPATIQGQPIGDAARITVDAR
jgi:hypothetical protein